MTQTQNEETKALDPQIKKFLQKSVVKKKVKFSNEEEVASTGEKEEPEDFAPDQDFECAKGSGVNQFQDMLEAEVKKQQLIKERDEQAAAENESFEHDC